jgi:hypothetical protein
MKTAMQELIDYVDTIWSNGGWEETIKEKAKELLEKEKEQIIEAYSKGYREWIRNEDAFFDKPEDYQYYKTINNQNK